jgi:hypothetical protein
VHVGKQGRGESEKSERGMSMGGSKGGVRVRRVRRVIRA